MTHKSDETTRRRRRIAIVIALAAAATMALPAAGQAAPKFGAYLAGGADPVDVPEWCPGGAGEACTRMAISYDEPSHAGAVPYAPKDGTIDKIKLIAGAPGSFKLQLTKYKGLPTVDMEAKVLTQGPKISYDGTGEIETFNVDVPVKQYQWLAMRTRFDSALQCEPGIDAEAIFQPPLAVGGGFAPVDYYSGCTHLVQAVME
jgi:hypothetical protein